MTIAFCLQTLLFLVIIVVGYQSTQQQVHRAKRLCGQIIYSPVQDEIEYEVRVFSQGFQPQVTEYWGPPTEKTNKLWKDLYDFGGGVALTREEASHLANHTSQLEPYYPGKYYAAIGVMHQLHCLYNMRMALFSNRSMYDNTRSEGLLDDTHLYHCVESLREALMCHGDISYVVMQWNEGLQRNVLHGNTPHSCRKFDKIREWARPRGIRKFNWDQFNMDPTLVLDGPKIQV
ncbi:uncharacterized protein SEPMUDRAFT_106274 [Sphaerulina musiva SO2202]|uniref:Tat pathway signal sequence n=1 Tax=Sphaerulina musiva (strain SO2202) TaxID=692275 RepID=M3DEA3_SPHMS|nr:uncharacterized protein SEPMUDRAFT_106274 [Sphaerulina musiva SO2202]EMF16115.1 hypothetical protein SEPMUDRAFT_106274 [Sphaerulina musiva SO2202]